MQLRVKGFWNKLSFQNRTILLILLVLLVIGAIGGNGVLYAQRRANMNNFYDSTLTLARTIWMSSEHAMIAGETLHIQQDISEIVASSDSITEISILSGIGTVHASSDTRSVGLTVNRDRVARAVATGQPVKAVIEKEGRDELAVVLPIQNKPECQSCHGTSREILGAIEVDVDREPLDAQIRRQGRMLGAIGLVTFLAVGLALAYSLRRGVVNPAAKLVEDSEAEQERLAKLYLTNRLASIGELASGVAHEINNPLTSILGFVQLILERDMDSDIRNDLQVVQDEAKRAARIVRNLLAFARKYPPTKQPANINGLLDKVIEIRAYEQKVSNIEVVTHMDPDLPEIMVDPYQIQQVFFNLVINAEYFMLQAHGRGTLTITTELADSMVRISFADDGAGIKKENMERLFTPFFTTKEVGKGTGLGLSICHGIVSEHGGTIHAESEEGKGATFIVELPAVTETPTGDGGGLQ